MHFDGFLPCVSPIDTVPIGYPSPFMKNCVDLYAQQHHPWMGGVLKVKDPLAPS
jgi:hypothetical protein